LTAANQNALALVESLAGTEFWGTLSLKFQHGQVIHITKEESIQPAPNHRRNNVESSNNE
jgi:hypothetical protein